MSRICSLPGLWATTFTATCVEGSSGLQCQEVSPSGAAYLKLCLLQLRHSASRWKNKMKEDNSQLPPATSPCAPA